MNFWEISIHEKDTVQIQQTLQFSYTKVYLLLIIVTRECGENRTTVMQCYNIRLLFCFRNLE